MSVQELRKEQARNLRYKKPIAKGLNWQDIWDDLYETIRLSIEEAMA